MSQGGRSDPSPHQIQAETLDLIHSKCMQCIHSVNSDFEHDLALISPLNVRQIAPLVLDIYFNETIHPHSGAHQHDEHRPTDP